LNFIGTNGLDPIPGNAAGPPGFYTPRIFPGTKLQGWLQNWNGLQGGVGQVAAISIVEYQCWQYNPNANPVVVATASAANYKQCISATAIYQPDPKWSIIGQSTLTVWCAVNGAIFAGFGLLLIFEYIFASCGARAARDGLRIAMGLLVVFAFAWLIAGNVWVFDKENNGGGVVIDLCKNGNLGNRNLYTFVYVIIIIEDILFPIIFAYTTARTCLQKTFSG